MKNFALHSLLLLLILLLLPALALAEPPQAGALFAGSSMLVDANGNTLPDTTIIGASSSRTYVVPTLGIKSLFVDIVSDKNATVIITPLPVDYNTAVLGAASDTLTVTGGTPARGMYTDIAAPNARVVVTNSEASAMTNYKLSIRGSVR